MCIRALVHRKEGARGCRKCFPKAVSVVEDCGNRQLILQSRTFFLRCRPGRKLGRRPRIRERRVTSNGAVEAADACSESSTELASIGHSKESGLCTTSLDWDRHRLACFGLDRVSTGLAEWWPLVGRTCLSRVIGDQYSDL